MPFRYPVSLELTDRPCVVIGGGELAEHKTYSLMDAGARVTVIAPDATSSLEELAEQGAIALVKRQYRRGDLADAFLAIAATDDGATNGEIFAEAEERRVLLNAVDDIEHCHFAVPSIVRRGDFLVALSTGGKAPALAKRLRAELSDRFGDEFEELVDLLGEVRAETLPDRRVDFATWAHRWQLALDHDLLGLVRAGRLDEARDIVRDALTTGRATPAHLPEWPSDEESLVESGPGPGKVWIVGAGPGDPALLTVKGREVLDAADVVVYDRLIHPSLLQGKEAIFVGKEPGRHYVPQSETNALLVSLALTGRNVVRLKGGDPFVFGRGAEEAEALAQAGIEFEIVPAPTSAIAALAYAGIPVTDRRYASSVAFVTGHCSGPRAVDWRALARAADTIVIFMGLAQLETIAKELVAGGLDPATPAAIVESGTLPSQRVITAELNDLPSRAALDEVSSPAIVVVGEVVRLRERIGWFGPRSHSAGVEGELEDVAG
jgi:uroporphyrin-III C-methyltransferase/precorrin-2 dehydrogenase/sirohydrochlorin ferrochelatase